MENILLVINIFIGCFIAFYLVGKSNVLLENQKTTEALLLDLDEDINELEDIGYKIAVMPLTLMSATVKTMQECLKNMKNKTYNKNVSKFSELREIVGFNEYYDIEDKYK